MTKSVLKKRGCKPNQKKTDTSARYTDQVETMSLSSSGASDCMGVPVLPTTNSLKGSGEEMCPPFDSLSDMSQFASPQ